MRVFSSINKQSLRVCLYYYSTKSLGSKQLSHQVVPRIVALCVAVLQPLAVVVREESAPDATW